MQNIPPLYPDEHFYNFISSYHILSGDRTIKKTKHDLFGTNSRYISCMQLYSHLETLCNQLPPKWNYNSSYIIRNHTEYPLIEKFGSDTQRSIANLGYNRNHLYSFCIQFCPSCFKEQVDKYGTAYLIRCQQDANVRYCYKHYEPLKRYNKQIHFDEFYDINCMNLNEEFSFEQNTKYEKLYIKIAKFYKEALSDDLSGMHLNDFIMVYNIIAEEMRYKKGNFINSKKILKDFTDYYGNEFLNLLGCNVQTITNSWMYNMFSQGHVVNPIKHFLIIEFLVGDFLKIKNFNTSDETVDNDFANRIKISSTLRN